MKLSKRTTSCLVLAFLSLCLASCQNGNGNPSCHCPLPPLDGSIDTTDQSILKSGLQIGIPAFDNEGLAPIEEEPHQTIVFPNYAATFLNIFQYPTATYSLIYTQEQLEEVFRLFLDAPISDYLPAEILKSHFLIYTNRFYFGPDVLDYSGFRVNGNTFHITERCPRGFFPDCSQNYQVLILVPKVGELAYFRPENILIHHQWVVHTPIM